MTKPTSEQFGVMIPARHASQRLPGKPLADLGGKPMIVRVLEVAKQSGAAFTLVATDDERIARVVRAAGGEAELTSPEHATGTDRLAEVVKRRGFAPETVIVNVQGDEPGLPPQLLGQVARSLLACPDAALSTLASPISARQEVFDPNVVKVVIGPDSRALFFSRAPIPWRRDELMDPTTRESGAAFHPGAFHRHIGLYAYRASTLLQLSRTPPAPIELAEKLEQLRALWLGLRIQVAIASEIPTAGVDTVMDLVRVQKLYEP